MNTVIKSLFLLIALFMLDFTPALAQNGIPLGSKMPAAGVSLANVDGGQATLSSVKGTRGTVVVFWSNECPWVSRTQDRLFALAETFGSQGIGFVLVNSNDADAFPAESLENSRSQNAPITYLMDPTSEVALAFGAERTPHVYVFDPNDTLVYVGSIDDSPGDPGNVKAQYLRDALQALVGGGQVGTAETKAFGCTIKFKG